MSVRTLTSKQLAADLQVTRKTLREWVKLEICPPPIWLGPGTMRFVESDILEWIEREKFASNHNVDAAAADVETK